MLIACAPSFHHSVVLVFSKYLPQSLSIRQCRLMVNSFSFSCMFLSMPQYLCPSLMFVSLILFGQGQGQTDISEIIGISWFVEFEFHADDVGEDSDTFNQESEVVWQVVLLFIPDVMISSNN